MLAPRIVSDQRRPSEILNLFSGPNYGVHYRPLWLGQDRVGRRVRSSSWEWLNVRAHEPSKRTRVMPSAEVIQAGGFSIMLFTGEPVFRQSARDNLFSSKRIVIRLGFSGADRIRHDAVGSQMIAEHVVNRVRGNQSAGNSFSPKKDEISSDPP